MKYVVMKVWREIPIEIPVMFPNLLVHADVAASLSRLLEDQFKCPVHPVSAGDATLYFDGVACSGSSQSLNLSSREDDSLLFQLCDYGFGIG